MTDLKVSLDEVVLITARNNKEIRVTQNMYDALAKLRPVLVDAARRGTTVTYKDAAVATDNAYLPQGLGPALDVLSEDCFRRDEPSLASLVVRSDVGEVGDAFVGDAEDEREACWQHWQR
ncbi:hypothetical protein [Nocardioides sp. zg-1230]|uniref:hypothetical protein n=1 Tax=Nocardioides sp. zg-1230 TaxID=2736601 RepID=UPI0015516AF1|nr:hypothetical protein [Nocardioides sp. zg-1230]NPC43118.1 hypothetical protein [Nocardioides sp. zg-1230]